MVLNQENLGELFHLLKILDYHGYSFLEEKKTPNNPNQCQKE